MPAVHVYRDGKLIAIEDDRTLDQAKAEKVAHIRATAAQRIDEIAPMWRQMNWMRDGDQMKFAGVDRIRQASNDAERAVMRATTNAEADAVPFPEG